MNERIEFELTYSALKMFGKQLYSNVGSAISELVANGLDAKASKVYVAINIIQKDKAIVEILDNGVGMSTKEIHESYIKIGYNKRNLNTDLEKKDTMGRKGIGKLAALYLSDNFIITTKKAGKDATTWNLDVSSIDGDSKPQLLQQTNNLPESLICKKLWEDSTQGTYIYLQDVNMEGLGERAFEALESKLSNFFLYDKIGSEILINIVSEENNIGKFKQIEKKNAFKNMAYVIKSDSNEFIELENNKFTMEYKDKLGNTRIFTKSTIVEQFSEIDSPVSFQGIYTHGENPIPYKLNGWIGIHASIDKKTAQNNDDRYIKNQFYNPNQLRIYVRKKLALSNIIEHLGITAAFANYIEGEVSFELLDDDTLEDIATAGRQDFDTQDKRFILLREMLKSIGNHLVRKRQALADEINAQQEKENNNITATAKKIFAEEVSKEIERIPVWNTASKNELGQMLNNKIAGELELKTKYTLFISHASKDKIFGDFIYYYLLNRGFNGDLSSKNCEIFYSSSGLDTNNVEPLSKIIKDSIISYNNDMLFITSENFNKSQYCLFEGGAAWATRSIGEYKIMSLDYNSIPTFLTNGKSEVAFDIRQREGFDMDCIKYNQVIDIMNRLIAHLNKNRQITETVLVPMLERANIPDKVVLARENKTIFDYMDSDILIYWNAYVVTGCEDYLKEKYKI